ncbi:hypothetical protein D6D54_07900 [Spiroplasma poulsonii]|uniref:Two component regulator propeller n=1 Tax=Spiroplasma poulsonii TaxID=2138 RepID=A0A433EN87_9MOLU|nr:hypothetical protein [Spiroplasma poulsonii]RUP75749.1 hypothetical protein D6D54_07900 [Spiroplasma poulsonii]
MTANVPAPLLANTPLTRNKRDVITSNSNNNYLPLNKIKNINSTFFIIVDSKDNVYFGTADGAYKLFAGSDTATKIDSIIGYVNNIVIDNNDNVYFGTSDGTFVLKQGSDTPTKIDGISGNVLSIAINSKDNIYFGTADGAFVLKQGSTTATKIENINRYVWFIDIDSKDNVYFGTVDGVYKLTPIVKPTPPAHVTELSNKLSHIEIAFIAIGSSIGVVLLVLGTYFLYKYIKKNKKR